MKHLLNILVVLIVGVCCQTVSASDPTPPPNGDTTIIKLRPKHTNGSNAPSLIYIECEYGDGYVQFTFPAGIYSVNVTLSSESYMWTGYASTDFPKMEIPSLAGEYTIRCEANDGRVFYGTLVFSTGD